MYKVIDLVQCVHTIELNKSMADVYGPYIEWIVK